MEDPLVLECGHAFCFPCMKEYQGCSDLFGIDGAGTVPCPMCRQPTPRGAAMTRVIVQASRAVTLDKEEQREERNALLQSSLDMLESMLQDNPEDLRFLFSKAEILMMRGDTEEALTILKNLLAISSQGEANATYMNERLDRGRELSAIAGHDDEAQEILDELEAYRHTHSISRMPPGDTLEAHGEIQMHSFPVLPSCGEGFNLESTKAFGVFIVRILWIDVNMMTEIVHKPMVRSLLKTQLLCLRSNL